MGYIVNVPPELSVIGSLDGTLPATFFQRLLETVVSLVKWLLCQANT
jgi:hypothetical protein